MLCASVYDVLCALQALALSLPGLRCLSMGRSLPWPLPVSGAPMASGAASWGDALTHFTGLDYLGLQMVHSVDPTVSDVRTCACACCMRS